MVEEPAEIEWKELDIYPEIDGIYMVSEFGEIRSKARTVFVEQGRWKSSYYRNYSARTITPRHSKHSPHLFVSIMRVIDGVNWKKTIYVHKIVAQLFLDPPRKGQDKVEHIIDDFNNNHYSNLRWVSHGQVQKRNMYGRHPENRDRLKNHNIKSGYYKNSSGRNKKPRISTAKRYYELKGDSIINNYSGESASLIASHLNPIFDRFKHRLISRRRFEFDKLTDAERNEIRELIRPMAIPKKKIKR